MVHATQEESTYFFTEFIFKNTVYFLSFLAFLLHFIVDPSYFFLTRRKIFPLRNKNCMVPRHKIRRLKRPPPPSSSFSFPYCLSVVVIATFWPGREGGRGGEGGVWLARMEEKEEKELPKNQDDR